MAGDVDIDAIEDGIFTHQEHLLKGKYGPDVEANYGWGIYTADDFTTVETKVYKHGEVLVTTVMHSDPNVFVDEWERYNP